jgi:hypothetical protein
LSQPVTVARILENRTPVLAAVAAIAPFVVLREQFHQLFWFGDEWDLLAQVRRLGFAGWVAVPFAENWAPLFKAAWLATVLGSQGSYFALLTVLWLSHALNVLLFALLLRHCGFRPAAVAFAGVAAGVPATNIETLGWSVQLSPVLSFTFLLLATLALFRMAAAPSRGWAAAVALLSLCSGLCFSRGVLAGLCCAALALFPFGLRIEARGLRLGLAASCVAASAAMAVAIARTASGNHQHLLDAGAPAFTRMAHFGAAFLFLNPLDDLLHLRAAPGLKMALYGALQVAAFAAALSRTSGAKRTVIALFALLDLGNAALVAVGRYHTGIGAVVSSRYQYVPLFCLAPALAALLEEVAKRLGRAAGTFLAGVTAAAAIALAWPWPEAIRDWVGSRGGAREALRHDSVTTMPNTAGLPVVEARAVETAYHLH